MIILSALQYGALMSIDDSTIDQTSLEVSAECTQAIKEGLDTARLLTEFQSLERQKPHLTKTARTRENELLNRYCNILPYDYNRVNLGVVSGS